MPPRPDTPGPRHREAPPSDTYGTRAVAARRDRRLATASEPVRRRILALPAPYAEVTGAARITVDLLTGKRTVERGVPVEPEISQRRADRLRREIVALDARRTTLLAEVEAARRDRRRLQGVSVCIEEVLDCFLAELDDAGYQVGGEPLTVEALCADRRAREWAVPRMVAMWLCRSVARTTLTEVAGYFRRDHSTVVHARERAPALLEAFPTLREAAIETCLGLGVPLPAALRSVTEEEGSENDA